MSDDRQTPDKLSISDQLTDVLNARVRDPLLYEAMGIESFAGLTLEDAVRLVIDKIDKGTRLIEEQRDKIKYLEGVIAARSNLTTMRELEAHDRISNLEHKLSVAQTLLDEFKAVPASPLYERIAELEALVEKSDAELEKARSRIAELEFSVGDRDQALAEIREADAERWQALEAIARCASVLFSDGHDRKGVSLGRAMVDLEKCLVALERLEAGQ